MRRVGASTLDPLEGGRPPSRLVDGFRGSPLALDGHLGVKWSSSLHQWHLRPMAGQRSSRRNARLGRLRQPPETDEKFVKRFVWTLAAFLEGHTVQCDVPPGPDMSCNAVQDAFRSCVVVRLDAQHHFNDLLHRWVERHSQRGRLLLVRIRTGDAVKSAPVRPSIPPSTQPGNVDVCTQLGQARWVQSPSGWSSGGNHRGRSACSDLLLLLLLLWRLLLLLLHVDELLHLLAQPRDLLHLLAKIGELRLDVGQTLGRVRGVAPIGIPISVAHSRLRTSAAERCVDVEITRDEWWPLAVKIATRCCRTT